MATPFNFGESFLQGLMQGRQLRQEQQRQQALNTFRSEEMDLRRRSLAQRAEDARRDNEIRQMLADLRGRQVDLEEGQFVEVTPAMAGEMGLPESFVGKRVRTDLLAGESLEDNAQSETLPVPPALQGLLGESVPASGYGAAVSGAFNLRAADQRQRGSADQLNPLNLRAAATLQKQRIGEIDSQLSGLDPFQDAEVYEQLLQERENARKGLINLVAGSPVDLSDMLNDQDQAPPPPLPDPQRDRMEIIRGMEGATRSEQPSRSERAAVQEPGLSGLLRYMLGPQGLGIGTNEPQEFQYDPFGTFGR